MLRKLFIWFCSLFKQNILIFESKPNYSDNTMAVYKYMIDNNILPEYKKIWVSTRAEDKIYKYPTLRINGSPFIRLKWMFYKARTKMFIFCNTTGFKKVRDNQTSLYLCHGSKSKNTKGSYEATTDLDYILIQADMFKEAAKYGYNLSDATKMITLGYPRNDDLLKNSGIDREKLFGCKFSKLLIWYPTFRQHKNGFNLWKSSVTLPIIDNKASAQKLNAFAKENDTLIVLKPHFMQDVSYIKNNNLSNLMIIDDSFFEKNNITSYQMMSLSDALLTDYSSVYYDYLLTDKPIGLVWEDYEEYKANGRFALDPDMVYSGGEKIYNADDFCAFIERIAKGQDVLKEERTKIKNLSNEYQDADSSKRVCEFIVSVIKNKKTGRDKI